MAILFILSCDIHGRGYWGSLSIPQELLVNDFRVNRTKVILF